MNLIVNSDPPVKENYDDLELQLFDFYKKFIEKYNTLVIKL